MAKKLVGAALCAAVVLGMGGSAFAGEITGSGKGGPGGGGQPAATLNGHASECAFSGLNDDLTSDVKTQNFGHRHDDPFFLEFIDESRGASQVTVVIDVAGGLEVTIGCNKHAGAEA